MSNVVRDSNEGWVTKGSGFFAAVPEGAFPHGVIYSERANKSYTWPAGPTMRYPFPEVELNIGEDSDGEMKVSCFYTRTGESFTLPYSRAKEAFDWCRERWQHIKATS